VDTALVVTGLSAAVLNLAVALFVAVEASRLRIGFARLVLLLVLFFAARAVERLTEPEAPWGHSQLLDLVIDIALLVLLLALVVNARRFVLATREADEYTRAMRHYEQVVRHRMMNPLTAIRGGAQTLLADEQLDRDVRQRVLTTILDASQTLEEISLRPERRGSEEHELHALPWPDRRPRDRRRRRWL
jgi:signal transduction histidine kinase